MTTHREAFIRTQNYYGIKGSVLFRQTGVAQNLISEFCSGKRDITTKSLDRLLKGMEELHSGALQFYLDELKGKSVPDPSALIDAMTNDQLSKLMFAIANRMSPNTSDTLSKELSINH